MIVVVVQTFDDEGTARDFVKHEIRYLKSHDMRCTLAERTGGGFLIRFDFRDFDNPALRFQHISSHHRGIHILLRDDENPQILRFEGGVRRIEAGQIACLDARPHCFEVREVLYETY